MSRFGESMLSQSLPEHSELTMASVLMGEMPSLRKRHGWHTDNESLASDDEIDLLDDEELYVVFSTGFWPFI